MTRTPKYAGWAIALGAALGVVAGILAGNVGVWLAIGVAIGVALGGTLGRKQKETDCPQCAALHESHEAVQRRTS
jgi:NAD/NADP transhydrogenase beta subunit